MNITIEDNKVVVNLDEFEFPKFEKMFANLKLPKNIVVDFCEFGSMPPSAAKRRRLFSPTPTIR